MADKLVPYRPSPLARMREAIRGYLMGPILSSDPNVASLFGAPNTSSTGLIVTESNALTYSAVWSAVSLISSQIGNLPLMFYRQLPNGGKDKWTAHPLYRLVHDRPNPITSAFIFRETLQAHVLLWGNAYAEIQRDGAGRPSALWPITPDRVTPFIDEKIGTLRYRIVNAGAADSYINSEDMLHIPGHGFNGISGYSLVQKMRESIGVGLAAEKFGATFFGNGATFGGVISSPNARPTDERVIENDRRAINARHQGVDRAHKLLLLYGGAKYERMGIAPNEAQFLETRQFQVDEVARWFNLPPHKLKELARSTNNNIEHQNLEYYIDCLSPWLERWEQELCEKLISPLERLQQVIEFDARGLLRGDVASRGEFYSKQFNNAAIAPNEIRSLENRNPIAGGDEPFVPLQDIPLSLARDYWQAEIDAKKAKAEADRRPPPDPAPQPNPAQAREIEILSGELADARRIAQEREDAKDLLAAQLLTAQAEREKAQGEWDAERAGLAADVARMTAQATSLGTDLITAQRDLSAAAEKIAQCEAEYLAVCHEKRDLALARVLDQKQAEEIEAQRLRLASQIEGMSLDITVAQQAREEAEQREIEVRAALVSMTMERESAISQSVIWGDSAIEARARITALEYDANVASERQQALTVRAETAEAVIVELRAQVATLTTDGATLTSALTDAKEQLGRVEEAKAEAERKHQGAEGLVKIHEIAAKQMLDRATATKHAIRKVLVYDLGCLIAREADRARKSAGTPEKFGKWLEHFYGMHEDVCRTTLRPAVTAWLVSSGTDLSADRLLDRVIPMHIGESTRQLRFLLEHDADTLAPALERILRRWEQERAEAFADRMLNEAA